MKKLHRSRASRSIYHGPALPMGIIGGKAPPKYSKKWLESVKLSPFCLSASEVLPNTQCTPEGGEVYLYGLHTALQMSGKGSGGSSGDVGAPIGSTGYNMYAGVGYKLITSRNGGCWCIIHVTFAAMYAQSSPGPFTSWKGSGRNIVSGEYTIQVWCTGTIGNHDIKLECCVIHGSSTTVVSGGAPVIKAEPSCVWGWKSGFIPRLSLGCQGSFTVGATTYSSPRARAEPTFGVSSYSCPP